MKAFLTDSLQRRFSGGAPAEGTTPNMRANILELVNMILRTLLRDLILEMRMLA